MDIVTQPTDYASGIAAGQGLAFNPLEAQLANAKVSLANSAAQGQQIQNAAQVQVLRMQQIELQRRQQFGQDMQGFVANPSAEGLASLVGRYPEFATDAENAWGTLDTAERRSTATQLGSVAALVAKGDIDSATELVKNRIAADQKAGRDPSTAQQMLGLLQSGDPAKQRSVIGVATVLAGGAVGFDKAKDFLDGLGLSQAPVKLGPGEQLKSPQTGETIASVAPNLTPVTVTNADGSQTAAPFNQQTGAFGAAAVGAPADGAPAGTPAAAPAEGGPGIQASIAHVLGNEGGFNPKDANGSPTNYGINFKANAPLLAKMGITLQNFRNMTQDQAAQIYAQKYWPASGAADLPANLQAPYFDVYIRNEKIAKLALAKSGGDPAKFVQLSSQYLQPFLAKHPQYANSYADRYNKNMAVATGAAPATASDGAAAAPAGGGAPAAEASPFVFGGSSGAVNTKNAPQGYAWNADHTAVVPLKGSDEDPKSYNPNEIDDLARNWIITGQPLGGSSGGGGGGGSGGSQTLALRKAIMARATQLMGQIGITADQLPALRAKYKADSTALTNMNGVMSSLEGSENALRANAQQVLTTQQALVKNHILDNGTPILNNLRIGTYEHIGSPETKAAIKSYKDAVNAFQVEYTKFMNAANGMGGSGAPSDASAERAQGLTDEGLGPKTMMAHIHQTLLEAANRKGGMAKQVETLQQRLSSYLKPQASALPPGAKVVGTYQGHRVIEVNGQRLVEQ